MRWVTKLPQILLTPTPFGEIKRDNLLWAEGMEMVLEPVSKKLQPFPTAMVFLSPFGLEVLRHVK